MKRVVRLHIPVAAATWFATGSLGQAQLISTTYDDLVIEDGPALVQAIGAGPMVAMVDQIRVNLMHSFVGDLTVKVIAPSGSEFTLFARPGLGLPNIPSGYGTNLGTDNSSDDPDPPTLPATYTFAQSGVSFENAADLDSDQEMDSSVTYAAKTWPSGPFASGTWQIFITDSEGGDEGFLRGAEVSFTPVPVPEPESAAIATGALLIALAVWRRKRPMDRLA